MSHLALTGEVTDETGMASTVLAAEVGYPGSSIAFAQLLSGMERSGLIEREIRGKRTYRIAAAPGASGPDGGDAAQVRPGRLPARRARPARPTAAAAGEASGGYLVPAGQGDFDYDELARRLLVQVVRQLASSTGEREPAGPGDGTLEQTVAGLEQELASVRTMHGTLSAENARLREQLRAARRSLALAQDRASSRQVTAQLDAAEVGLLERLLAPSGNEGSEGTEPADPADPAGAARTAADPRRRASLPCCVPAPARRPGGRSAACAAFRPGA